MRIPIHMGWQGLRQRDEKGVQPGDDQRKGREVGEGWRRDGEEKGREGRGPGRQCLVLVEWNIFPV